MVLIAKYLKYGQARPFFKALFNKELVEKEKQAKGGKKPKQRLIIPFVVNAAAGKINEPVGI